MGAAHPPRLRQRARARSKAADEEPESEISIEPELTASPEMAGVEAGALVDEVVQTLASPEAELLARGLGEELASSTARGAISTHGGFGAVDDFGLSPATHARMQPMLDWLYTKYFRVRVAGMENIPAHGPALLVCNHGGALPWDGLMLATAVAREHAAKRSLRWLVEDFAFHAPFLGAMLNRIGAVRACPENAARLLEEGHVLAVFPEGVQASQAIQDRYRLQRFVAAAHKHGPVVWRAANPGIAGSDDTYPLLYKVRAFSKSLGLPFIPVTPTFPMLGPIGLAPLPSRFQIEIGTPLDGLSDLTKEAADDTLVVHDINDRVRRAVAQLLEHALGIRGANVYR